MLLINSFSCLVSTARHTSSYFAQARMSWNKSGKVFYTDPLTLTRINHLQTHTLEFITLIASIYLAIDYPIYSMAKTSGLPIIQWARPEHELVGFCWCNWGLLHGHRGIWLSWTLALGSCRLWRNVICADSAYLLRWNSALARPPMEGSTRADATAQALRNIASCCQERKDCPVLSNF